MRPTRLLVVAIALAALTGCSAGTAGSGATDGFVDIPGIGSTRVDVPRPTGAESAPCDGDPMPPPSEEAIADRVKAMRQLGLFADRSDASDDALAAEVEQGIVDTWGSLDDVPPGLIDLAVAEQDPTRVWWRDLEADVVDGNDVYAHTLAEWSEISAGAFEPTGIAERWEGSEGPVTVSFSHDGQDHSLQAAYLEDWIDPGILVGINDVIADSGRRFELYKAFDQTAFVMALTDDERRALEARGWCFE